MNRKVLFIGYGIFPVRKEAVSLNTNKLAGLLGKIGIETFFFSLSPDINFVRHLFNRSLYIKQIEQLIIKNNISHVHDVFVLPLSSVTFVEPLIKKFRKIKFIKEVHNDYGTNSILHTEKILRLFLNSSFHFRKVMRFFDVMLTRNKHLSEKYNFYHLPPLVNIFPSRKKHEFNFPIKLCYLGHPLKKKGIDIIAELMRILPQKYVKSVIFNFAFSNLGDKSKYAGILKNIADEKGIEIKFKGIVDPSTFFRENDILILPLYDEYSATSTPNTIFEAMEAGCVVFTTETSLVKNVIHDGENGILFSSPTAILVLKKILWAFENRVEIKNISEKARNFIVVNYRDKTVFPLLKKLYD